MELHITHHPDWSLPMTNTPVPPPKPAPKPQQPIKLATERHNMGRAHLAHVLNWWLAKSGLSTRQLSRITGWSLGEHGWLEDSKISYIRRNQFKDRIPLRYLDAMGCANQSIWTWQCRGETQALSQYGPPSKDRVKAQWLTQAIWIPHPDYPSEPLGPVDFFEIATGYLDIPQIASPVLAPSEGPQLTEELCHLLLGMVSTEPQRDQIRRLVNLYPKANRDRRDRLASVLLGASTYESDEIQDELGALASIVAALRGVDITTYGPNELYAELTRDRKQIGGSAAD